MQGDALAHEPDASAGSTGTEPSGDSRGTTVHNGAEPTVRQPTLGADPARTEPFPPMTQPPMPRWLDEVRAQRRALQQQRRAAHQARREALDPIGTAQREQRKDQLLRRRQEMRERIEQGREQYLNQYYLNQGPWFAPLAPMQDGDRSDDDGIAAEDRTGNAEASKGEEQPAGMRPSEWNNLWYYNGW